MMTTTRPPRPPQLLVASHNHGAGLELLQLGERRGYTVRRAPHGAPAPEPAPPHLALPVDSRAAPAPAPAPRPECDAPRGARAAGAPGGGAAQRAPARAP